MRQARFTMNAFLLIVIIFSAIYFAFTIFLSDVADRTPVNDYYRIEGSDFAILYSNKKTSGIYEGLESSGQLRLKGTFGHDWGIALQGNSLYATEYTYTEMKFTRCDLAKIDLVSFDKEILYNNCILRGRCASGELVCIGNFMLPSSFPKTNPICSLYAMTDTDYDAKQNGSLVMFIDPESGDLLYETEDRSALREDFDEKYLNLTLDEIIMQ